jgi:hypothetical protein
MAELDKGEPVSLEELMVSTLAMTDALAKLLIEKGVITDAEFKQKLLEERAVYQRILESHGTVTTETSQNLAGIGFHYTCSNGLIVPLRTLYTSAYRRAHNERELGP